MSALALGLVLLQSAAATPAPTPPAPTPTPRPVTAGPRTLQDVARERKLSAAAKGKGTLGTISVGPSTSSTAPAATPEAAAPAEPGAEAAATPTPTPSSASVRVTTVTSDGIVDPGGLVRVNGTLRNGGSNPACNVVVTVKIMDKSGNYLASAQAAPDIGVIAAGEVVSFHALVQAPPGVRGNRVSPDRKDATEGSTTMAGEWKVLGATDAAVTNATEDCPR